MTTQQKMRELLTATGLPHKDIHCYGSQIVITAWSRDAANQWASVVAKFAKVRAVIEAMDDDKVNTNTVLKPSWHKVWRVFGCIQ